MKTRHRKTLEAIFKTPAPANIVFADIESLIVALGGSVEKREGSRVAIALGETMWHCHRPHPGKEAKRYQVREIREILEKEGVTP